MLLALPTKPHNLFRVPNPDRFSSSFPPLTGITLDVAKPPALHKPISEPSEFWTLVNGELLDVPDYDANNESKVMVESRLSVNRLRRRAQHGETPAPALWSATVYNVATSDEKSIVLEEDQVNALVEAAKKRETKRLSKLPSSSSSSPSPLSSSPSEAGTIVHRQGIRLECGDLMVGALASVYVKKQGPHIRVQIKLHFRGRTAFSEASKGTFYPPPTITLHTTTYEIVARLKKQVRIVHSGSLSSFLTPHNNPDHETNPFPRLISLFAAHDFRP